MTLYSAVATAVLGGGFVYGFLFNSRKLKLQREAEARSKLLSSEDCVIIGCGFAGLCAAVKLSEAGIPCTILEKNDGIGGAWFDNRYPGSACGKFHVLEKQKNKMN